MNVQNKTITEISIGAQIRAVLDKEWIAEGATQDELDASRQLADRYEELLIKGCSENQIDALWKEKTPQEILAASAGNGHTPSISFDHLSLAQLERLASLLHFEDDVQKNANRTDLIVLIENGVRRTGKQPQLAAALKTFKEK